MAQTPAAAPAPQPAKPKPPVPPPDMREDSIATLDAAALIAILKDSASSEFKKAKACVRAGELGAKEAVPVLAALLADQHLGAYARYGLEPIADPSADDALRAALPKLKGNSLIGAVNSLGKRRDAKAIPALVRMMQGADTELARAAASALGHIGTLASAKELRAAMSKSAAPLRTAVADAGLICAERLLAGGNRAEALDLYAALSAPDVPKPMRLAAMNAIVREETSIHRPR
ncbi:MAG: HEAT repeat domain-containing protein [Bryobacterales bacterium]|nr:HEAT repeat domain-containing protein [Bryobacterales bacterium]